MCCSHELHQQLFVNKQRKKTTQENVRSVGRCLELPTDRTRLSTILATCGPGDAVFERVRGG